MQWQELSTDERKYFKDKADTDKLRYLNDQRDFYDEVEKIGKKYGTIINENGQVSVAK